MQSTMVVTDASNQKQIQQTSDISQNSIAGILQKQGTVMNILRKTLASLFVDNKSYSKQFCQLKIRTIEQYWDDVQQLHYKIWNSIDEPTSIEYDAEEYFNLAEEIQSKLLQLYDHMGQHDPTNKADISTNAVMKLPKIALPQFDGDYLKWRQFHDLFTEVVHKQQMSECQKMWYLKTSLTGEAEKLVRHLTISDMNYSAAWKIITERYENSRLLVTALLNRLLSQPNITNEGASAIRALHDTTQECLLGLENLGINTNDWDPLLLHLLIKRLDRTTHTLYEQSLTQPRAIQSIKNFLVFLETRFQSLEALGNKGKSFEDYNRKTSVSRVFTSTVSNGLVCTMCKGIHQLFSCRKFLQLTPTKRLSHVKAANICFNCLNAGHRVDACTSRGCTKCSKRHNTLLHTENSVTKLISSAPQSIKNCQVPVSTTRSAVNNSSPELVNQTNNPKISLTTKTTQESRGYVLLSTIMVKLINNEGKGVECRAILDSGSQLNFVTEKIVKQLGLTGVPEQLHIEGIGQRKQQSRRKVSVLLQSRINQFTVRLEAHVLPKIISLQPTRPIDTSLWSLPHNIALADPTFDRPGPIDLLIGAEIYYSLMSVGQIRLGDTLPTLQNTVFGWTVAGKVDSAPEPEVTCGICSEDERLDQQVERFWKLEDTEGSTTNFTTAEKHCETHFNQTTRRSSNGRFIVSLPFLDKPTKLGESKDIALQRFTALERKLERHQNLKSQYVEFMEEYIRLGHMQQVNLNTIQKPYYFLPHHCVMKPDSSTTKLRVVFDASAKTSSSTSLNDILSTGPTIQDDVFSILLRFRLPRFVFTADIEKMYRQIEVDESDRKYQLIWWRTNQNESTKVFQLSTVTYGTTCAPYLATKCLERLAEEQAQAYPLGSEVLKRDFYVDDVLTGADSITAALDIQSQLQTMLGTAGFKLRKWCANHQRLLQNIPQADQEVQLDFNSKVDEHIKTVGLIWLPKTDSFCVKISQIEPRKVTKRTAYSDIAHLYDPLGIMAPVVVTAKLFLQKLWTLKIDWDAALPQEMHTAWNNFRQGLRSLNNIKFPRHVFSHRVPKRIQIHVFADASEKAYGASAYIRSIDKDNIIAVRLLCAKSRIAPMKQTTLPRLELCAAKLAAELANRIKKDLRMKNEVVFLWSDSEIVLAWINSTSSHFHTFVANRVSHIQELSTPQQWRHVGSKDNPADILSRGIDPEKLEASNLWFYGPTFLHGSEEIWPGPYSKTEECDLERKRVTLSTVVAEDSTNIIDIIDHGNSYRKLQRVLAYILRFIATTKNRHHRHNTLSLSTQELDASQIVIIRHIQSQDFKEDLSHLKRFGEVTKNSSLSSLTPFIDNNGIIRVGGRLQASQLQYDSKHQILLPYTHPFTKLLLTDLHKDNYHVGPQALLSIARQRFWPIKGKTLARSIVKNCVRCTKVEPKLLSQLMGNLPADRVQPARPFVNSGVDFCGPIWTHYKVRGKRPQKTYIAVFCCFATKATHLELVSDLSTQGFLGALKRFMARRGHCKNIYCDNATNFVGAKNQLEELRSMIDSDSEIERITGICSTKGTEFHLIPPRAPHFGGLWEAAVKAAKHLLQRTLASASLTYEELETAVIEVEAILNSRPLTPMSSDPNDLSALTPGHFLIGEPLVSTMDANAQPLRVSLITRWKLVAHIKNEFWRRWSSEYLNQLQHRYKWKERCQNVQPGTMVLMKEDNVPALKWPLARILSIHHGGDGLVRVADVRTSSGILRRPIHKLAPLPIEEEYHSTECSKDNQCPPNAASYSNIDLLTTPPTDKAAEKVTKQQNNTNAARRINDGTHHTDIETRPRKRARKSLGSAMVTLLLTCLILPVTHCSPLEVKSFESQPGIYFENLGTTNIISSEWNIIAYYDVQHYWNEFEVFTNSTQTLNYVCHLMTEKGICLKTIEQFKRLTEELSRNNELLQPNHSATRTKRGALNFVGNIANALFGVLDSNYSDKMSDTIDNIQQNEDHLSTLIRNQTSLIDTTVNIMKKNQEIIDKQFQQLEVHINRLVKQTNGLSEELSQQRLSQTFTALTMQVTLSAINFQRIQAAILDVLIDTHHGKISPQLISPLQLRRELTTIKEHIPSSLRLPVTQDEILKIYNLMTIESRIATRHLIFRLRMPLLRLEEFELFKIVPVPVLINNTFVTVQPSTPYLVVNLHRDQYYPLTEQELQSCDVIAEEQHLCKQRHPIYRRGSAISSCEMDFINHQPQSPSCQVVRVGDGPHWIQLNHPNEWIYVLKDKTTLNVVCGNNVTQVTLKESGILKIQGDCVIKHQLVTIQGHSIYPSVSRISYTPSGNLTDFVDAQRLLPNNNGSYHYHPHWEELDTIKGQLQRVYNELPAKTHIQSHDIHQFAVAYIGLFLAAAIIAVIIWKFRATVCQHIYQIPKPRPKTAPRTSAIRKPDQQANHPEFSISFDA